MKRLGLCVLLVVTLGGCTSIPIIPFWRNPIFVLNIELLSNTSVRAYGDLAAEEAMKRSELEQNKLDILEKLKEQRDVK